MKKQMPRTTDDPTNTSSCCFFIRSNGVSTSAVVSRSFLCAKAITGSMASNWFCYVARPWKPFTHKKRTQTNEKVQANKQTSNTQTHANTQATLKTKQNNAHSHLSIYSRGGGLACPSFSTHLRRPVDHPLLALRSDWTLVLSLLSLHKRFRLQVPFPPRLDTKKKTKPTKKGTRKRQGKKSVYYL